MANEVFLINGVTKEEKDGTFYYFFPLCVFQVYPDETPANGYFRQEFTNGQEIKEISFSELTDNLGTADIMAYVDKLAADGYFFTNDSLGGGTGSVEVKTEDLVKMHSFRNSKLVIGDTDEEIVLFSFKRTGTTNVKLKNIQLHFLIVSNDYAHIRLHRNPTYTGVLTYSSIQGSAMTGANGDEGSPSNTQISAAGVDVQSLGFIDQRNYGKELFLTASIDVQNNTDEFVFTAICGANDTKIYASINFIEV